MRKGAIQVIYGAGHGKTEMALGRAIIDAEHEKNIIMIQFLKGNQAQCSAFLRRMEPEFKVFSFERNDILYDRQTPAERQEEVINIKNGLNYAKKVMVTGECDVLILDGILGLLDYEIICLEDLKTLLKCKNDAMDVILTGRMFPEELKDYVDEIACIETRK